MIKNNNTLVYSLKSNIHALPPCDKYHQQNKNCGSVQKKKDKSNHGAKPSTC